MGIIIEVLLPILAVGGLIWFFWKLARKRDPAEVQAALVELRKAQERMDRATAEQVEVTNRLEDLYLLERRRLGLDQMDTIDVQEEQHQRHQARRDRVQHGS